MSYKYRDMVKVVEGFYEGAIGQVVEELEYSGTEISKLGTKEYKIKVTSFISVPEADLEVYRETKKGRK